MKGMKQTEGMKHREWFDEYKARNRNTNEMVLMARVKNGLDVEGIESRFPPSCRLTSTFCVNERGKRNEG